MSNKSIRDRRLESDFKGVSSLVNGSGGTLRIISTSGTPQSVYEIEYNCRGIERLNGGKPVFKDKHRIKISIEGTDYPREKPNVHFLTPIYHPNVFPTNNVCLGDDYWTMAENIAELILRVGKIIQYSPEVLNTRAPANSEASKWAKRNSNLFPTDHKTFKSDSNSPSISWNDNPISWNNV